MQNSSNQSSYEYGERKVKSMPKRTMSLINGQLAGYVSSFLGVFSFFSVLCFLFPTYLTTQTLRDVYNPDFLKISEGFYVPGSRVDQAEDLEQGIKDMLAHDGPYLLHVTVEKESNVFPIIPTGMAVDEILLEAQNN